MEATKSSASGDKYFGLILLQFCFKLYLTDMRQIFCTNLIKCTL